MEQLDEILSPQACARCGNPFVPPGDRLVFCPRCHACHAGVALPQGVQGSALVSAWLRAFGASDVIERAPVGFAFHRTEGGFFIISTANVVWTTEGYCVLIEHGSDALQHAEPTLVLRLAGFRAAPPSLAALPPSPLSTAATLRVRPWGLELLAARTQTSALRQLGQQHVVAELARVARELGLEPVFVTRPAAMDNVPPEVAAELDTRERTIRCSHCGAPVALPLLVGTGSCPYCLAHVHVPPELAHELELHRRRMRVHDAMRTLDTTSMWAAWTGASGDVLACAVCGAPTPHRAGATDERCGHCGATVIPSAEQLDGAVEQARSLDVAREQQRQAQRRAEAASSQRLSGTMTLINVGMFVGLGLLGTVGTAIAVLSRSSSIDWKMVVFVVPQVVFFGLVPLLIVLYLLNRSRRQKRLWPRIYGGISDQLEGRALPVSHADAWLTHYWGGPAQRGSGMYGPSAAAGAVAAEVGGLPVLIDGDLEADVGLYRSMYGRPWLRVIIAAGWPRAAGVLKATRGVRERRARLEAMGFRTCVRRGGLELEATPELLHRLKKQPVATAVVVPVLYEALRIVRLMGATPPRARTA